MTGSRAFLGLALAAALLFTGCSIPLTSDEPPPAPSPTVTAWDELETEDESEVEDQDAANTQDSADDVEPEAEVKPVKLSKCVKPTKAEAQRIAELVRDLGLAGKITRTAAVRFDDYAVIATYIKDSPNPGYPDEDVTKTWLVSSDEEGNVFVTEVATRWYNVSEEVQKPGREARERALDCIS